MPSLVRYDSLKQNLLGWITEVNELSDLVFCYDAGDIDSYDGSAQAWNDIGGAGNHLWRGTNNTSQVSDPTFNGSADGLSSSEFFSFDGGDQFTPQTVPMASAQSWHKANGKFTLLFVLNPVIPTGADITSQVLFATATAGFLDNGINYRIGAGLNTGKQEVFCANGSGVAAVDVFSSTASLSSGDNNKWNVCAFKGDAQAGAADFCKNTTIEGVVFSYTSPTASNAFSTAFAAGGWKNLNQLTMAAAWSRRLSDASYNSLYAKIKQRITSLP